MTFETILTNEQIDRYTSEGYWADRTITDFLDEYAAATPDAPAFVDSRSEVTYAELKRLVDRAALGFLERGIAPGDVISFQLPNWIEWIIVHYAASRIGAISNPLIPIYRDREVGFMLELAESKLIVVPQEFRGYDFPAMVDRVRDRGVAVESMLIVGGDDEQTSWETFIGTSWEERRDAATLDSYRPDANDVTLLIFTSGTTGEPKGVMHTHNTAVAANAPLPERLGITADSVIHMASTLGHLTGFLYGARLNVQNGATCVLQDVWDAGAFVDLIEKYRITYTSAATPFLHDLLNAPNLAERDVSSLERFCCMGAPIPRVLVREAKHKLPDLTVLGGWGQTEEGLVTLGIPGDSEEKIIETDGYPWPGLQVRVVDAAGRSQPPGTEGALQVRGPFVFVGYAKRLDMTRSLFHADDDGIGEWFDTGDLAFIDSDGYLRISGRAKDVIIRGGENIPVAYVENALYGHPDIDAVAIVAMPDPRLQERACACVVLKDGADELTFAAMQAFLEEEGVAKNYWPEKLVLMAELPKTPSGKIQKFHLRDQIAEAV